MTAYQGCILPSIAITSLSHAPRAYRLDGECKYDLREKDSRFSLTNNGKLSRIWKSRNVSITKKIKVYESLVTAAFWML